LAGKDGVVFRIDPDPIRKCWVIITNEDGWGTRYLHLDNINVNSTYKNLKWYIDTTKDKIGLIRRALDSTKGKVDNSVIYTIVLRIRTLHTIKKLIKNEKYSKKEFLSLIDKISGSDSAYEAYVLVKNNLDEDAITTKDESERLCSYLTKQLKDVIGLLR